MRDPTKSPKAVADLATFQPAVSLEQSAINFLANLKKDKSGNGQNSCLLEFLKIATLLGQYQSFDFGQFLSLSRSLDLQIEGTGGLAELFNAWTEQLILDKKLKRVQGCYNFDIFSWV